MARKTIEVATIRDLVNTYNERSADHMAQERAALNTLLEIVLHDTGNYHGFEYLDEDSEAYPYSRRRYYSA